MDYEDFDGNFGGDSKILVFFRFEKVKQFKMVYTIYLKLQTLFSIEKRR